MSEEIKLADTPLGRFMSLDATSHSDMHLLAEMLDNLPAEHQPMMASMLVYHRLMIMKGRFVRFATWLARKQGKLAQVLLKFFNEHPQVALDIIEKTATHCLNGKDLTSPRSVGGWNQQEVDLCVNIFLALADSTSAHSK